MLNTPRSPVRLLLIACVLVLLAVSPARAVVRFEVPPVALAGLRDSGSGPMLSGVLAVGKAVVPGSEDRVVVEFDISGLSGTIPTTTLGVGYDILAGTGVAFHLSAYEGDGAVTPSDFSAGALVAEIPLSANFTALSLNVTAAVQAAMDAHQTFIGFRISGENASSLIGHDAGYRSPVLTVGGVTKFVPTITSISPARVAAGSGDFVLEVTGTNFVTSFGPQFAFVQWAGNPIAAFPQSPTRFLANVSADLVAGPDVVPITVESPAPMGGLSNEVILTVFDVTSMYVDGDAPGDPGPGDPNVSDPLEDGTPDHPFDTVQEALSASNATSTIHIGPGTYVEDLIIPRDGVTLEGSGAATTILRAKGRTVLDGYNDSGPLDVVIRNLTFDGGDVALGANDYPSTVTVEDIVLRDGTLSFNYTAAVVSISRLDGSSAWLNFAASTDGIVTFTLAESVIGTTFVDGRTGSKIDVAIVRTRFNGEGLGVSAGLDGHRTVVVSGSEFLSGGIQVGAGGTNFIGVDLTVTGSTFHDAGVSFEDENAQGNQSFDVRIEANRFLHTGVSVFGVRGTDGASAGRIRITNNVMDGVPTGIGVTWSYPDVAPGSTVSSGYDLQIVNNTLVDCGRGFDLTTTGTRTANDGQTTLIENNIIAGSGTGVRVTGGSFTPITFQANDVNGSSIANYSGDIGNRTGKNWNIASSPQFVDRAGHEFRLRRRSRCVDAGRITPEVPATDIAGDPRVQDGDGDGIALPDMGAFELRNRNAPPVEP
ncbi:MAG: hypothetical protein HY049_18350 [Acidobacteria bacterium]|nr:hypothetical protein [Acidobacteriota bacterium]